MRRKEKPINQEYFEWLCGLVGLKRPAYTILCNLLNKKIFRWSVNYDVNRCEDGIELRYRFVEENNMDEDHLEVRYFLKGECTVFEMMVALSSRMNDLMYDLKSPDRTGFWFLKLLDNLDLEKFTDNRADRYRFDPIDEAEIDGILEALMDRTYDFNGNGSLFPLKHRPRKDRTQVEIWYQMMDYLKENYQY